MKSIRYRKLMEAARRHAEGQPLHFMIKTGENESCQCSLSIWKEQLFCSIEKCPPLKEILLQFKDWIDLPYQVLGKKSSEIALSRNRLYCLKILNTEDVQQFQRILQDYAQFKTVEQCMLAPVFGLVTLYSHSIEKNNKWLTHFLFMPYFGNNSVVFDIKGHCDNRVVDERDFKDFKFGKDQNFIKSSFLSQLQKLNQQTRRNLFRKIETNVLFFQKVGVIDYSLLLIFRLKGKKVEERYKAHTIELNESYDMSICIIDFLQGYNSKKKLQNKIKTIFFKEVSSVDPQTYAKRLLQFMRKALLIK